jgi:hypothetical protein
VPPDQEIPGGKATFLTVRRQGRKDFKKSLKREEIEASFMLLFLSLVNKPTLKTRVKGITEI